MREKRNVRQEDEERKLEWQRESGGRKNGRGAEAERVGEKRKCLKMRLSHWFKMSNSEGHWKQGWILQSSNTHRDTADPESEHRLYIGPPHESHELQNSGP